MPFVESGLLTTSQTGDDVIEEVLRLLLSSQREEMNKLATNVAQDATILTFQYELSGIQPGSLVNIDTETYRVWDVNSGQKTATVEPAMNGSRSSSHTAGSLVYVNPRFSRAGIFKALNDEIMALSSPANGLFQVKSVEFAYQAAITDYDLPNTTNVVDVWRVLHSIPGATRHWITLNDWRFRRSSDVTKFPSGNALFIPSGITGQAVQVHYKAPFTPLTSTTENIETGAGVPTEAQDILALGVLLRLGPVREIKRNFTEAQGDSRRSEEVPPNAVQTSFGQIRAQRQLRIDQEAMRLSQKYRVHHR